MDLDWASLQAEAAKGGLLPDGDYNITVVEATATKASTGKPQIKVKFRVIDGPHEGKPVWAQFTLTTENPIALRIFFQHMAAFGLDSSFFGQLPSGEEGLRVVADNLRNRAALATLGVRPWQGNDRQDVKNLVPLPAGTPLPPGLVTGPPSVSPLGMTPSGGPPVPSMPSVPTGPVGASMPGAPPSPATPATPPPAQPF